MKIIINGRFLIHRVTGVERYARMTAVIYRQYIIVVQELECWKQTICFI